MRRQKHGSRFCWGRKTVSKHWKCKKKAALVLEADPAWQGALLPFSFLLTDEHIRKWKLMICSSWRILVRYMISYYTLLKWKDKRWSLKLNSVIWSWGC